MVPEPRSRHHAAARSLGTADDAVYPAHPNSPHPTQPPHVHTSAGAYDPDPTPPGRPPIPDDESADRALDHFRELVDAAGTKPFAEALGVSTRQVNRILAGAQPNPIGRLLLSLNAVPPEVGDRVLDYICEEMGGYFVREEGSLDEAAASAVKECAEAIAAIADGEITTPDLREIRDAIGSLVALSGLVQQQQALPARMPA